MKAKLTLLITALTGGVALAQCPDPTPSPPTNPSVTAVSAYDAKFEVDPITGSQRGFHAERSFDNTNWVVSNSGYPNGIFFDQYQLLPNQEVYYRTRAYDACGEVSLYSAVVEVTMPNGPMPYEQLPAPPRNLMATVNNNNTVTLTWTPGAFGPGLAPGQAQTFQIARKNSGVWKNIQALGNSTYIDSRVSSGQTYTYKVQSYNNYGWGSKYFGNCSPNESGCGTAYSNSVTVTMP